jgi:hypothetical protein
MGASARRALVMVAKTAQQYLSRLGLQLSLSKPRQKDGVFSNFDEERILAHFIDELLPANHSRVAVDIGAGDGVKSSNTYALFRAGWRGLGVEGHSRRARRLARAYKNFPGVVAHDAFITPDNVVPVLRAHDIPADFSVLSLDIDSYDYWVLDALLASFRPRLIVTEINEKVPPPIRFVVSYDPDFQPAHHFFGHSIESLADLCARHAYAIIALEYNNAFLAPLELDGVQPLTAEDAYRRGYLERADRHEKFHRNHDMEILHALSPAEGVKYIERYFAPQRGKYEVSAKG